MTLTSVMLASSQGLLIVTGMAFWAISKRMMTTAEYNEGLVLINALMLIGSLSGLNGHVSLPTAIARRGSEATGIVARALGATSVLAAVGGFIYYLASTMVDQWPVVWAGWLTVPLACAAWNVFALQDGTLAGVGHPQLVPIENLIYGFVRIGVLVGALTWLGSANGEVGGPTVMILAWVLPLVIFIPAVLGFVFGYALPRSIGDSSQGPAAHPPELARSIVWADAVGSIFGQVLFRLLPLGAIVVVADEDKVAALSTAWLVFAVSDTFLSSIGTSLSIANPADGQRSTRQAAMLAGLVAVSMGMVFIVAAPLIMAILVAEIGSLGVSLVRFIGVALMLRAPFHLALARARMEGRPGPLVRMQVASGLIMTVGLALALLTEDMVTIGATLVATAAAAIPFLWYWTRPASGDESAS